MGIDLRLTDQFSLHDALLGPEVNPLEVNPLEGSPE